MHASRFEVVYVYTACLNVNGHLRQALEGSGVAYCFFDKELHRISFHSK